MAGGGHEVCGGAGRGRRALSVEHAAAARAAADEERHPGGDELRAWWFLWFRAIAYKLFEKSACMYKYISLLYRPHIKCDTGSKMMMNDDVMIANCYLLEWRIAKWFNEYEYLDADNHSGTISLTHSNIYIDIQ